VSRTIEVDEEVYRALEDQARPFAEHSPNDVLRRMLGLNGTKSEGAPSGLPVWPVFPIARYVPRGRKAKLDPESYTPMAAFRAPILRALLRLGGQTSTAGLLRELERELGDKLTAMDREWMPQGNDIRWRKAAQWQRYRMAEDGLLFSPQRGEWAFTEAGWAEARRTNNN